MTSKIINVDNEHAIKTHVEKVNGFKDPQKVSREMFLKIPMWFDSNESSPTLNSNLKNLLLTAKGERFMQPDFGTRIRQVLFDNNTDNIRQELKDTLTEDIEFWLPYIEVSDVVITTDQDRYTLQIQLSFLIT